MSQQVRFTVWCLSLHFLSSNYPNEGIITRPYIEGLVVYTFIFSWKKMGCFACTWNRFSFYMVPSSPFAKKSLRPPELQEETELQKVSLVMEKPSNLD